MTHPFADDDVLADWHPADWHPAGQDAAVEDDTEAIWQHSMQESAQRVHAAVMEAEGADVYRAKRETRRGKDDDNIVNGKRCLPLLRGDAIFSLPDPEWLIEDMIGSHGFYSLVGAPGLGKTFVGLDFALCVATGVPFHGKAVKQGDVLYCLGEGHAGVKLRIEAWFEAHPEASRALFNEHFVLVRKAVALLQDEDVIALINTTELFTNLKLFIIDTWARAMLGGEENSATDTGRAVGVVEEVRDLTGATGIVVHHTAAGSEKARGSTALLGAVDGQLSLAESENARMELRCFKQKDSAPFAPMPFDLVPTARSVVLELANDFANAGGFAKALPSTSPTAAMRPTPGRPFGGFKPTFGNDMPF